MPDELVTCSNCHKRVKATETICPECGMGLEPLKKDLLDFSDLGEEEDSGDISIDTDDLLNFDSLDEEDVDLDESELSAPSLPTMDTSPAVPAMDASPAVPSMDTSPTVPSMDSPQVDEPKMPSFSETTTDTFTIPSFDSEITSQQEPEVKDEQEVTDLIDLHNLPIRSLIWLFGSQYVYWFFVFFIINVASFKVLEPTLLIENLIPTMIKPAVSPLGEQIYEFNTIQLSPVLFIFGWLSYLPMGWFFKFKLEQYNVHHKWYHVFTFLAGFLLFSVVPAIIIPSFTGSIISRLYFLLIPIEILITFFTLGIGTFYLGYSFLYQSIYSYTPISKIPLQNLE